ncbi:GerAB/ArcD/ProY family transporter [Paenibacillus sp. FSL K6-1318]|uniref:GerAB/ArcD/ProY family transporter n=1 Tax=Paenibacillus sp. FSL K6-1318 TaxID=2975291 RepID=UPI0030EBAB12
MASGLNESGKLTTLQGISLIIGFIVGVELFTLPREVVHAVKSADAWLSVILGGCVTLLLAWMMIRLSRKFPGMNFYEFVQQIVGTWIGKIVSLVVIAYYIHLGSYEMRAMEEVTSFFLLEGTPWWAIQALFVWISLYLCMEGTDVIAKVCQIIVPITIVIYLLILLLGVKNFDVSTLRPFLSKGMSPVFHGMSTTTLAFSGSEIMLFILAKMEKPEKAVRIMGWGLGVAIVLYTTATILCIGAFTAEGVTTRVWPFFDLTRSVEVENLPLERFESLLLSIWVLEIFATFNIAFYCAALGLSHVTKLSYARSLCILLPIMLIVSRVPRDINELFQMGRYIGKANLILFSGLSLILLLISRWRSKLT